MNPLLLLKKLLEQAIENIDAGNTNLTEEECLELIDVVKKYNPERKVDRELTVTDICKEYHITRQTFYRKINAGIIPEGIKKPGRNPYWKESVIASVLNNK